MGNNQLLVAWATVMWVIIVWAYAVASLRGGGALGAPAPPPEILGHRSGTGPVLCSFKTGPDRTGPVQKFGPVPTAGYKEALSI